MVQTLVCDMNVSPLHANVHAPNSGDRSTGSQTPGDPATHGALDNEELFVIEDSKTDPWRSTPEKLEEREKWRTMRLPASFQVKNTLSMTDSEALPLFSSREQLNLSLHDAATSTQPSELQLLQFHGFLHCLDQ